MRMSTTAATLILPEGGRILDDFYQSDFLLDPIEAETPLRMNRPLYPC